MTREPFPPVVMNTMFVVTEEWLNEFRTPRGGWLNSQTLALGYDWPLEKGWKKKSFGMKITEESRKIFESGAVGRKRLNEIAKEKLGIDTKQRETKAERRARRALERQAKLSAVKKVESLKKAVKTANKIAKSIKPKKVNVSVSGVDVASAEFLSSFEWRRVRMVALKKYGPVCMCCGASPSTGAVMNVDHIKPRKLFPQLALDVDNLQILCSPCNHGKGNWDETDWRPKEIAHS